jgi:hypothetical protein
MGKQNYVLQNKERFSDTPFPDVKKGDWFAPYVGFCKRENIISGFPDGEFKPNEYVTEKAFLTMLLSAMEYDSQRDFTWENVYSMAYEVGITDKIENAVRKEDNSLYYRKDVVHNLFLSLDKYMDDKQILMIENLINQGVTWESMAEEYGLNRKDEVQTRITSATVHDYSELELIFNEDIENLYRDEIEIKGKEKVLIADVDVDGKKAIIHTKTALYSGDTYTITISEIEDTNGFKVQGIEADFEGQARQKVESDLFRIKDVEIIDSAHIMVTFTHPIDKNAESALNYRFGRKDDLQDGSYSNIEIKTLESQEDKILVEFLDFEIESGNTYTFYVRGDLKSAYQAYMNKGNGDEYEFVGEKKKLGDFTVSDVDIFDAYYVKVEFSRTVDYETAFTKSNYELTNMDTRKTQIPRDIVYMRDDGEAELNTVLLEFSRMRDDEAFELEVDGVQDVFNIDEINRYEAEFEGDDDVVVPKLDTIDVIDRYTMVMYYDMDMEERSESVDVDIDNDIEVAEIIWREEEADKIYVYLDDDTRLEEDERYEVEVGRDAYDFRGVATEKETEIVRGTDKRKEEIEIESVIEISPALIMIKFSDFIDMDEAENDNLYEVEYRVGKEKRYNYPESVQVPDGKTVILEFDTYPEDYEKVLIVKRVDDPSGQFSYTELEFDID